MSFPLQLAGEVSGIVGHGEAHMSGMPGFSLRPTRKVRWTSSLGIKRNDCANDPAL